MEALSAPSSLISHHPYRLQPGQQSQNRFKLMLVHDGYQFLDQAVQDLKNSGFPEDSEVLLLSVSDLFRTPLHLVGKSFAPPAQGRAARAHSLPRYRKTRAFFDKLESVKLKAHAKLQAVFPLWDISFERPLSWEPDLIYLGAFNPSSATDTGLGEMIRKLAAESSVPLRVARPQLETSSTDRPTIVAIDGPASAAAILTALQRRQADAGNDLHLMFYKDPLVTQAGGWSAADVEPDREWINSQQVRTKSAIEALGFKVSLVAEVAQTARAILTEAKRRGAASIVLGTRSFRDLDFVSGQSIAISVAVQAECPVEIVFSAPQERPAAPRALAGPPSIAAWKGKDFPRGGVVSSA